MGVLAPIAADRLRRVLVFLSVSGGAALVSKRRRRVVANAGDVDDSIALASLDADIDPTQTVVHTDAGGLVADVGLHHRLFVRVPPGILDPSFVDRVWRARDLIERFALDSVGNTPPTTPPSSAPAHVAVFAPRRTRRSLR